MAVTTTNTGNRDAAHEMARRVRAGQVELAYRQLPPFLFSAVVTAILLAVGLWPRVSRPPLILWVLSILGLSWVCYRCLQDYRVSHPIFADRFRWAGRLVIGFSLQGVLWGVAGFYFFVSDSTFHQTLLVLVLAPFGL